MLGRIFATLAALLLLPSLASAQQYAFQNPTYIPTATLPATTLAAPGNFVFVANGQGELLLGVTGTFTGLAVDVSLSPNRPDTPTWTVVGVVPASGAGGTLKSITGVGLYRVNVAGAAQVRVRVNAISTGSVVFASAATTAQGIVATGPVRRVSYAATFSALTPAASLTDIVVLPGNATTVVRVQGVRCYGTATANGVGPLSLVKRTAADTVASPTPGTVAKMDSSDPAASSTPFSYAANPTLGAGVAIRQTNLTYSNATTTTIDAVPATWTFGLQNDEEVTLRGVAQQLAVNGVATTVPSGGLLTCDLSWTEE